MTDTDTRIDTAREYIRAVDLKAPDALRAAATEALTTLEAAAAYHAEQADAAEPDGESQELHWSEDAAMFDTAARKLRAALNQPEFCECGRRYEDCIAFEHGDSFQHGDRLENPALDTLTEDERAALADALTDYQRDQADYIKSGMLTREYDGAELDGKAEHLDTIAAAARKLDYPAIADELAALALAVRAEASEA